MTIIKFAKIAKCQFLQLLLNYTYSTMRMIFIYLFNKDYRQTSPRDTVS